jgi:hypothetical protein
MNMDLEEKIKAAIAEQLVPEINTQSNRGKQIVHFAARSVLSCLEENGMVVVPREPTEEMIRAGYDALVAEWPENWSDDGSTPEKYEATIVYPAMLAAAPKQG